MILEGLPIKVPPINSAALAVMRCIERRPYGERKDGDWNG